MSAAYVNKEQTSETGMGQAAAAETTTTSVTQKSLFFLIMKCMFLQLKKDFLRFFIFILSFVFLLSFFFFLLK